MCICHKVLNSGLCVLVFVTNSFPPTVLHCTACQAGEYASAGDSSCQPCPNNSNSEAEATICTCDEGYYRSETEGPEFGCTREFACSNSNVMMPAYYLAIG